MIDPSGPVFSKATVGSSMAEKSWQSQMPIECVSLMLTAGAAGEYALSCDAPDMCMKGLEIT
jgi:hypothetical protein